MSQTQSDQQGNNSSTVLLLTASYDRTIRYWEALSGICSKTIQHPDSQVNRLAISPDKRLIAAAGNPNIRVYEALAANNQSPLMTLEGHSTNVTRVQFQANSKWLVSCSEDGTLKVYDMRTTAKVPQREYSHGKVGVSDVAIHPNQIEVISCDYAGSVRIWDLRTGGTGTAGTSGQAGTAKERACTHELVPEEDAMMRSVSIASDASLLTAGTHKGNVYIWKMIASSMAMPTQSTDAATKNSSTITGHEDVMWEVQPVTKLKAHDNYMLRSVLSPDVKHLATASADQTIRIWSLNANAQQQQEQLIAEQQPVFKSKSQNLMANKQLQAPLGNNHVSLKKTLTGHQNWVWDCAWSVDSEYLVSASSDHTARLWDLTSGESIRQYQGHHKAAVCICLNDFSL